MVIIFPILLGCVILCLFWSNGIEINRNGTMSFNFILQWLVKSKSLSKDTQHRRGRKEGKKEEKIEGRKER